MKKSLLFLLVLFTLVLVGCKEKEDNSLDRVISNGKLVVGFTEFPPMGYEKDGEYVGFDIDVAKKVCEKLGVELELKYIDWDAKVFELESGRVDAIWNGMTITLDRAEQMTISKKYFDNQLIILTTSSSAINSLSDLNGKVVGVESTSSSHISILNNLDLKNSLSSLKEYNTSNAALLALESGQIDAMIVDYIYAKYYVLENTDKFKICDAVVGVEEYGIGYLKGSISLKEKIDEIIDKLAEEGIMEDISIKWFGKNLFSR